MDWIGKVPAWLAAGALTAIAVMFLIVLAAQPNRFEFGGLGFGRAPEADMTMVGAVVAFDRSTADGQVVCPDGWSLFEPSIGRVILGAGSTVKDGPPDNARAFRPAYSENARLAVGGEEKHKITKEEIPEDLEISVIPVSKNTDAGLNAVSVNKISANMQTLQTYSAKGAPMAILPPFVSLYYCKKDKRK